MTTNLVVYVVVKDTFWHSASIQSIQQREYSFTFKTLRRCFLLVLLLLLAFTPLLFAFISLVFTFTMLFTFTPIFFGLTLLFFIFAYCFLLSHCWFLLSCCCNVILFKYLLLHAIVVFLFTFFFLGIHTNNTFDILP
jgi:hypothetical protein